MTMLRTLDLPTRMPACATAAGRTLEPETSELATWHQIGYSTPARKENWVANLVYQWLRKLQGQSVMNWNDGDSLSGSNGLNSAIYHPNSGLFVVANNNNGTVERSPDGRNWTGYVASNNLSYSAENRCAAIDNSNVIFGNSNGDLQYSSDAGSTAWSTVSSATIGGSGTLYGIHTKYPDSNFAMLVRGTLNIRIASSGVGGSWVGPTTGPTGSGTPVSLVYAGGSSWYLLEIYSSTAVLYVSLDDGDTWAVASPGPGSIFSSPEVGPRSLAINRNTGRIIIGGGKLVSSLNVPYLGYSDNAGDNWTESSYDLPYSDNFYISNVYYCGGTLWIATAEDITNTRDEGILVSIDDGESWEVATLNKSAGTSIVRTIACDGKKLLVTGDSGFTIVSNSI